MMFSIIAFLSALSVASAGNVAIPTGDIAASSPLGSRILSAARRVENNGNNQQSTWVINYSIRFENCAVSEEYYGGYFGGQNGNNNNNQNNNNDRQNYNGMYQQRLVHFKLCPTDTCSAGTKAKTCQNGAEYVIDMNSFVNAYVEAKMTAEQYECEKVRENCYCENANDDGTCYATCYANAGLTCQEEGGNNNNNNNNGQNGNFNFNLQEAVACAELKDYDEDTLNYWLYQQGNQNANAYYYNNQNNNNNNNKNEVKLSIGPYCSDDGKSIFLGVFMDETCSNPAPTGIYEKLSYGQVLPYSTESLVANNCWSCKEPADYNNQNNNDQQDADTLLEVCENVYAEAGKCETGLADGVTYYKNTYGCNYIATLHAPGKKTRSSMSVPTSKIFAGLFAVTTLVFGGVAYYLYQKVRRQKVNLSGGGGSMA